MPRSRLLVGGVCGVGALTLVVGITAQSGSSVAQGRVTVLVTAGDSVVTRAGPVPASWRTRHAPAEGLRATLPVRTGGGSVHRAFLIRKVVRVPTGVTSVDVRVRSSGPGRLWWDGEAVRPVTPGVTRVTVAGNAGRHLIVIRLPPPHQGRVGLRVLAHRADGSSDPPQDAGQPDGTPTPASPIASPSATSTPDDGVIQVTRVCAIDDPLLPEISGMAPGLADPGVLWVHNDSGDSARIFALDRSSCAVRAEVRLAGVAATDIEGIAMGRTAQGSGELWVADIGDNGARRPNVRLYRLPEPTITDQTVPVQVVTVTWSGGARDSEGIAVDPIPGGDVFLVSKQAPASGIYRLTGDYRVTGVATAGAPEATTGATATDAAIAPDRSASVIRFYGSAEMRHGILPGSGPVTVDMPTQRQGEAISFAPDSRSVYLASEGSADHLIRVPLSEWPG